MTPTARTMLLEYHAAYDSCELTMFLIKPDSAAWLITMNELGKGAD